MTEIVIRYQKFGSNWDVSIAASLIEFSLFGGVHKQRWQEKVGGMGYVFGMQIFHYKQ